MADEKKDEKKKEEKGIVTKLAIGFAIAGASLFIIGFGLTFIDALLDVVFQAVAGIIITIQRGVAFINSAFHGLRLAIGALGQNLFGALLIAFIYVVLIRVAILLFKYGLKQTEAKEG